MACPEDACAVASRSRRALGSRHDRPDPAPPAPPLPDLRRSETSQGAGADRGPARGSARDRARRLRRAAGRRASVRVRAGRCGAAGLAHRLHRLGRHRRDPDGHRRAGRRWPLHPAGARAGRYRRSSRSCRWPRPTPEAWIGANLKRDQVLGYDPWLHTPDGLARLERAATKAGRRGPGGAEPRRRGLGRPAEAARRPGGASIRTRSPARRPPTSSPGSGRPWPRAAATPW